MGTKRYVAVAAYLTPAQIRAVKSLALKLDRPAAWIYRAAIDAFVKANRRQK